MKKSQPADRRGFTLIELLVVIGIIGLLIAVAIPNYLAARQRAGDSRKKADISQLKSAMRLYYNDFNRYPPGGAGGPFAEGNGLTFYGCGLNGILDCKTNCNPGFSSGAACDTVYMKQLPSGFVNGSITIKYYQVQPLGDDYCIKTTLDNQSDPDIALSQARCASACGATSANCSGAGIYCDCAN